MPPSSSHFAESPFPAPATIIGLPAEIVAPSRAATSSRVYRCPVCLPRKALLFQVESVIIRAILAGGTLLVWSWPCNGRRIAIFWSVHYERIMTAGSLRSHYESL